MDVEFHNWIVEQADSNEIHLYRRTGGIEACQTEFQSVEFVNTASYGKVLILDGAVQSAEDDEYLYHEALVHPGMITHGDAKRILIIGGGEGATLREVLKYNSVESVVMVDLDRALIELCKRNLKEWHRGAFDDLRVKLFYQDGRAYLQENEEKFDVMIIDVTDILVDGPALGLYTREFYSLCKRRLNENGVIVVQALELSATDWAEHAAIAATLGKSFAVVRSYATFIPSFICTWGFLIGTDREDPATLGADEIAKRIAVSKLGPKLRAYDEITHAGMFCLSKDLRGKLARQVRAIEDGKPLVFDRETN
jgi:spermidine synthase